MAMAAAAVAVYVLRLLLVRFLTTSSGPRRPPSFYKEEW
jgi:hypothetical protein